MYRGRLSLFQERGPNDISRSPRGHDMPETGQRFRGLALRLRAEDAHQRVCPALRLGLKPRRVGGVRRRQAPARFLALLAVVGVVGVALAVDLVTDHPSL